MARIRSTHATQWNDDDFIECSPFARLLALALRNFADDQGVFEWKPGQIKRNCLPADACDVRPLLKELVANKQVQPFTVDGKDYGAIRNFRLWQRPKAPTALYPLPLELRKYVGLLTGAISVIDTASSGADFRNEPSAHAQPISELGEAVVVSNSEIAGADVGCRRLEVGGKEKETPSSLRSEVPHELPPEPIPKPKVQKRTQIPEDCPSKALQGQAVQFWGVKSRHDLIARLDDQVAQFRDHHLKNGSTMADWDAAWRTWYRKALEFTRSNGHGRKESTHEQGHRIALELIAELAESDTATDHRADYRPRTPLPQISDERCRTEVVVQDLLRRSGQ